MEDPDSIKKVITSLSNTERNFVMKNGESTITTKELDSEAPLSTLYLEKLSELIDKIKN